MAKGMPYLMMPKTQFYVVIAMDVCDKPIEVALFDNDTQASIAQSRYGHMGLNASMHNVTVQQ